jgi:hypothetical protein
MARNVHAFDKVLDQLIWKFKSSLWNKHITDECLICYEPFSRTNAVSDGPLNSDFPIVCAHWACTDCWQALADEETPIKRCPFCREDLTDWLDSHYALVSESDEETDDDENDS